MPVYQGSELLQRKVSRAFNLLKQYDNLLNSCVLDFFTHNHWNSLPKSWLNCFDKIELESLEYLFSVESTSSLLMWPLSILAIKSLLADLTINRKKLPSSFKPDDYSRLVHPKLKIYFTKHVKPKKKHEIEIMSRICYKITKSRNVKYIVDFGSGVGHLCRLLSFGYQAQVCGIEQQADLIEQARKLDMQAKAAFEKVLPQTNEPVMLPKYLNMKINEKTSASCLIKNLKHEFGVSESEAFECGFIGLHPCGDLGAILMNIFLGCSEINFINFAGCCYMKLTTGRAGSNEFVGYPLSEYVRSLPTAYTQFTYESLKIACHAIEMYSVRLKVGKYEGLKIHSYRATIETIIAKRWPELKHSGLKSVKFNKDLSFKQYCEKAVEHLNIQITENDISSTRIAHCLSEWKKVVIFYTLRLMLAPLVESVIQYDRLLYLHEQGCYWNIKAVFDPSISSRNHIITAAKR